MEFFQILKKDPTSRARLGVINTAHGKVNTPTFCPIGTKASVKVVTAQELKFWKAELILANTYHLWLRPGDSLIRKAGGLHKFMGWDGPILTDSGGFQVFSLGDERKRRNAYRDERPPFNVKVTDRGVTFQAGEDGSIHELTPEKSIQIQTNLGADIALMLDDVPAFPATKKRITSSLAVTNEWAKRAKVHHEKLVGSSVNPKQQLFGIIQGGFYKDLRQKSASAMRALDFSGYAIGGVSVGEPEAKMLQVLDYTVPELEEEKPRHLLGVGLPDQLVRAVARGCDTFDCVIPTRHARHGQLFVTARSGLGYAVVNISNKKYEKDFKPVDSSCDCYLCMQHTRAYLRHLFAASEPLSIRLATMHNLKFYLNLMEKVRRAIKYESFDEMVKNYKLRRS
jgi:queuine tRNA-ribosyltransferase